MATILDIKPVEKIVNVAKLSNTKKVELLMFFGIMREKKEYEKLKAMKEVADAKYKLKSFSRQVREIEKNITKLKEGKPVKTFYTAPLPQPIYAPDITEIITPVKPIEPNNSIFISKSVIRNDSSRIEDVIIPRKTWPCEKCDVKPFTAKKLLKLHISEIHCY